MSGPFVPGAENATLSETDLAACRPVRGEGGRVLRAFCPFHGSDRQRSLRVDLGAGRFNCFACGAWGYMDWARERWREERTQETRKTRPKSSHGVEALLENARPPKPTAKRYLAEQPKAFRPSPAGRMVEEPEPARGDLAALLAEYQAALPGSWGEEYLRRRGIPLELARRYGVGYAPPGKWAHEARDWKWGRVVIPHTAPDGRIVNLYGRAVGADEKVPKEHRHDHLPGAKGYFNAAALREGDGPLLVCEGPFDALSLLAAGYPRAVAIFGLDGWRWNWARGVRELVLALDADARGREAVRKLAREAALRGRRVYVLPEQVYDGHKDLSELWAAKGRIDLDLPDDPPPDVLAEWDRFMQGRRTL